MALVDSHVHFWDPSKLNYPWLESVPQLNRPFLPEDFAADAAKIVFVESGCRPEQALDEVDWISALARNEPRIKGIVAHAPLEMGTAIVAHLKRLAARPLVKGVRRNLQDEPDDKFYLHPGFISGVKLLATFGYTFDVCVRHEQLGAVVELVAWVPEVTFVLDHFGKPDVRGRKFERWAADLEALAAWPNVVCKTSGLTTQADWPNWRVADLKPYLDHALNCFGFERLLFGGDWPVATLATTWQAWLETISEFVSAAGEADCARLFQTNAERTYRV